ncbi:vWA domain-containing protein [Nocardia bovistercoris]|uniref:VWA domain-containing protein n=1 Tax=Nocardia bovistercoris TaxID=2785916 RepID=A0A931IDS8_9NOCA|nr:vWA domain-containing protein [Nocardia bovistercoris]MBH0779604.1 VWA domain-containing protein [Nocardia bovistercoris]
MRQRIRRVAAVIAIALASVLLPGPAAPAQPQNTSAVVDFGACLSGQQRGDLLLLLDESRSLMTSDPDAARVPAAQRLLQELTEWTANSLIRLDVAVAGFGDEYTTHHDWVTLDRASLPGLDAAIAGARDRTKAGATDYGLALREAHRSLVGHRGDRNPATCRAVAWFTDGELDFSTPADPTARIEATKTSICRPGGTADLLRATGIRTFAIGLAGGGQRPDFGLLSAIATGAADPHTTCGDIKTPRPGEFYLATDIGDLLAQFTKIATGGTRVATSGPACRAGIRTECEHRFVLDNSIRGVKIEADAGAAGLTPTLVAPDGSRVTIDSVGSGSTTIGGVPLTYRWTSENKLSFTMARTAGAQWRGAWAFAFVDKRVSGAEVMTTSRITIYGDLVPTWTEKAERKLHAEERTRLRFGIADREGKAVKIADVEGTAQLSVSIIDNTGVTHEIAAGLDKSKLASPVEVDLTEIGPGPATLRLALAITTAPSGDIAGTALTPEPLDIPLTIAPPIDVPELAPLDFGTLEGAGEFKATVQVTGTGCVWLPADRPAVFKTRPEDVGTLELRGAGPDGASGCAPGVAARAIPVTLRIENAANGVVSGVLPVTATRAENPAATVTVEVPFRAEIQKPPDKPIYWLTLALTVLLGPGIPILLLYLLKWLTTRIPAQSLKAQRFPVRVRGSVLHRDGRPFALRPDDLVHSVPELHRSARRITLDGIQIQARGGWSPIGLGRVVAAAPGMVGASNAEHPTDAGGNALLPLHLHSSWFVLCDPSGPADEATLVLLVSGEASASQRTALVADARDRGAARIATLLAEHGRTGASDSTPTRAEVPENPFAR